MGHLSVELLTTLNADHLRHLSWMEQSNADVLVHSSDSPHGYVVPPHRHIRTQFLCVFGGVVLVSTDRGRWMIPPGHALLIPRGLEHSVEMFSDVSMRSVYLFPPKGRANAFEPAVLRITDLAHHLLAEAVAPRQEDADERRADLIMQLLIDEIGQLPERPLGLPFPQTAKLAGLCRDFLVKPDSGVRIDDWADKLNMSRRSFTRLFREETGVSFSTWRQQACIFACLPRLADGEAVTSVALEAGYESVPAFTTMFKRMLGASPRLYFKSRRAA